MQEANAKRIGKEYILIKKIKGERGIKPTDDIQLGTKTYQRSYYEQKHNQTVVQEINR